MSITDFQRLSASQSELVLSYQHAIKALDFLQAKGASLLAWEGWLRYPNGTLGHSCDYQGCGDLSKLEVSEGYRFAKQTIRVAHEEYEAQGKNAELLFCITSEPLSN
ncbi:hypothetical protein [Pseudomonas abietaniphila]|uniref:Uncharacterized protein n=1 Tax=Pseudomonas abietaniphila TaxID=89065 RepID=A0A1G8PVJ2_9PSED|nr:hypothetical protein [Pseudomonas abietaniphila]SDI96286.1 hypothetical protein SAMN05216605_119120 [Pseudomonas abietaniphila]